MKVAICLGSALFWGYVITWFFPDLNLNVETKHFKIKAVILCLVCAYGGYRFADMCCSNYEKAEENSRILQEEAKYEAIVDGKVEKYIKCYDQKKHHICEAANEEKIVVDDYWKIGETNEKN